VLRSLGLLAATALATASLAVPAKAMTPVLAPAAERAHPRALFFGDSYFVGGGCSPDRTQDMAYLAGTSLGYRTTVRGAGGTGFVAGNPDYDLPPYLAQIRAGALDVKNPRLVVIAGGSNDVGFPVAKIQRHATRILHIAGKKYPHATLVLVGPMDPYGGYADSTPIRDGLRAVAKKVGVPFVDDLTWLQKHPDWLCDDYVHPTYAAEVALGRMLAKALAKRGA
jgi:lysophospholipase L1-like esterase